MVLMSTYNCPDHSRPLDNHCRMVRCALVAPLGSFGSLLHGWSFSTAVGAFYKAFPALSRGDNGPLD